MSGKLYLVGTPIGNLGDMSPRGIEILKSVHFIAAEDTRRTRGLMTHFGIKKPLVSYHEHNMRESGERITTRILAGEDCALVTDAGMPAISDPGEELVRLAGGMGIPVIAVPGPSAVTAALALSGLPSVRFAFEGFLPVGKKERRGRLSEIALERRTMVFYEAPHRISATLSDLYGALGDREVAIARELTKIHEEVIRTTLSAAEEMYESEEPRGEFVLVVGGWDGDLEQSARPSEREIEEELNRHLSAGGSGSDAVKLTASALSLGKNEVYSVYVSMLRRGG